MTSDFLHFCPWIPPDHKGFHTLRVSCHGHVRFQNYVPSHGSLSEIYRNFGYGFHRIMNSRKIDTFISRNKRLGSYMSCHSFAVEPLTCMNVVTITHTKWTNVCDSRYMMTTRFRKPRHNSYTSQFCVFNFFLDISQTSCVPFDSGFVQWFPLDL